MPCNYVIGGASLSGVVHLPHVLINHIPLLLVLDVCSNRRLEIPGVGESICSNRPEIG
jgi:hypothetical protein